MFVQVSERVRHMYRDDLGHGIIEIRHGDNTSMATDRWLVVNTVLGDASKVCSLRLRLLGFSPIEGTGI